MGPINLDEVMPRKIEFSDRTMARPAIVELGQSAAIPILKELDASPHAH